MKKKLLSILISLAMVLTMMPMATMTAFAEEQEHPATGHGDWESIDDLSELQALFSGGGSGYLAADINCTAGLTVAANVNLCLNGKKLDLDDKGNITVNSGKTFNLYDCGTAGTITKGSAADGGGVSVSGIFNMYGGSIFGNTANNNGGGVFVDSNATFNMYGGSIANNTAKHGGGVGVGENGTFTMSGNSRISGNEASLYGGGVKVNAKGNFTMSENSQISLNKTGSEGGGVFFAGSTFQMNGGSIDQNAAPSNGNGGGVYVDSGTFNMNGGKITGNTASSYAAGVYVDTLAAFAMKGDSIISGNTGKQGAGVYTKGTFTMSGSSEITKNTGTYGGGVQVANGGAFYMSGSSKITYNAGTNGGGLCVMDGGLFNMFDSSAIDHNSGSGYGGGLFVNGSVTLGGEVKITDNVVGGTITDGVLTGGTANNVYLPNGKDITLGTAIKPTGNFKVGVTTQTGPREDNPVKITTNGAATDKDFFTSDNSDYEVQYNTSGYLELAVKTTPSYTIADILPEDFPTSYSTAWTTEEGLNTCHLDSPNSNLMFVSGDNEYTAATAAPVTPSGDDYVYTDEDGLVTFNMEDGELTSITVKFNEDDKSYVYAPRFTVTVYGGSYIRYCRVEKGTAYSVNGSTLTLGTETYTATAEGKEFDCWKIGETVVTEGGTITADTTFTAVFKAVHTHSFTYTANGGKLTATCTDGCTEGWDETPLTLTLTAPASLVYDANAKAFTFADGEADAWTGAGLELPTITYYQKYIGQEWYTQLDEAPVNAGGDYMVEIVVNSKVAQVKFTIDKAMPYIKTNPAPSDINLGGKLADSTLAGGYAQVSSTNTTQVAGLFEWTNPETVPGINDSEVTEYDVTFTPVDETNYNSVSCKVKIKINHTHAPVLVKGQAATKEASGWKDYYECACGALFEDENGTTPIDDLAAWKAEGGRGYIPPLAPASYTVTFDMGGHGTAPANQTVNEGGKATKPETDPTEDGWTFGGWFKEASCANAWDFDKDTVESNTTLYAKWTKNVEPAPEKASVLLLKGATSGKKAVKLSWSKVPGATKYVVYGQKCGSKSYKKLKTTSSTSYTVKKIKGKKLKAHKTYKFYVVAYKGSKKLVKSKNIHFITAKTMGKYANVKSIKAKASKVTLNTGASKKIGATYKMYYGKKHIKKSHGAALRYISNCPSVATVSSNGTVTAKAPGTATIYIQDIGGRYCKTTVTVK